MRYLVPLVLSLSLAACAYAPPPAAPPPPPPPPPPAPAAVVPPPPPLAPPPVARRFGPARVEHTAIGPVLADPRGLTLYTLTLRGRDVSCYGRCAHAWPPFYAARHARPHGPWSPLPRVRGLRQWAFRGHRLYTFFRDHAPGETHGNGIHSFGGVWHVARP